MSQLLSSTRQSARWLKRASLVLLPACGSSTPFFGGPAASSLATDGAVSSVDAEADGMHAPPAGPPTWVHHFDGTPTAVAIDGNGAVVVAGQFAGTIDVGAGPITIPPTSQCCAFLAVFDPSGALRWSTGWSGAGAPGVAFAPGGDVLVVGSFAGTMTIGGMPLTSAGGYDGFLARFGKDGLPLWSRSFGGTQDDFGAAVASDSSGAIYVAGSYITTLDLAGQTLLTEPARKSDVFVASLDATGTTATYAVSWGDPSYWARAYRMGVNAAGDVAVSANTSPPPGEDAFIIDRFVLQLAQGRLTPVPNPLTPQFGYQPPGLAVEASGNTVMSLGSLQTATPFAAVAAVLPPGAGSGIAWVGEFGQRVPHNAMWLSLDEADNLALATNVQAGGGAADFGTGTLTGGVIAKLGSAHQTLWARSYRKATFIGVSAGLQGIAVIGTGSFPVDDVPPDGFLVDGFVAVIAP